MEPIAGRGGIVIVNDTYNANPQSLEVALRALAALRGSGRAVAVLGDMGELGDATAEAHAGAGRRVAELGLDRVVAIGEQAETTARAAREAGLAASQVLVVADGYSWNSGMAERTDDCLNWRQTANPSIPGMTTSSRTISGLSA